MAAMESDTMTSVIIPTVIMAILFLGNAVVLYVLFMLRKRNKKKCAQDEERAAIVTNNGSTKELKNEDSVIAQKEDKTVHSTVSEATANGIAGSESELQC